MKLLRLSFLMLGLLGGALLANCGSTTCSAATCGGCCDSTGKCQSGTSIDACGIDGESCGRCGANLTCARGTCEAGSNGGGSGNTGGGSGSTGGGTGTTGGGGGSGCRQIAALPASSLHDLLIEYRAFASGTGYYNFALWGFGSQFPVDGLRIEVVYPNSETPVVPPVTRTITNVGYQACRVCAVFNEGCNDQGVCQRDYLAQQGTITIQRADRAAAGRISGSATGLRFVEWDLERDMPVNSGRCVEIGSVGPLESGWNADGGMPPP